MNLPIQLSDIAQKWKQQEPKWRTRVIVIAAISLLVMSFLLYIAFRPNYITVFHGLSLEDAAAITSELQAKRISTRLENAGTAIAVPRKQADQARLEAAAVGLPRTGRVGYDLFNKSSFSMTESERALQQQLLLEQELALTLEKIAGIRDAEVKLALPKENIFLDPKRQTQPTASVWVNSTQPLDSSQVNGVVHLVSRAVPNLLPENVTVIDAEGRVLNASSEHSGMSFTEQQTRQQALQLELERSINTLLGQIFGEENVAVRVVAELDFDQRSTQSVRFFAPQGGDNGLVRQIEELSDYYSGEGNSTGGPPGTDSNPGEQYLSPAGQHSSSVAEKRQRTIAYELDEIRETITYAPGAIKRLSVSVIVNDVMDFPIDTAKVQAAVEAAVGYDADRDDIVSVQTMSFHRPEEPVVVTAPAWYDSWIARIGIGLVLLIALFLLVKRMVRRRQLVLMQELQSVPVAATVEPDVAEPEFEVPQEDETERLRKHLEKLARQKPDDFAVLVRAWLDEES